MKKFLFLFILIFGFSYSQNITLSGYLEDSETGESLIAFLHFEE